MNSKKCRKYLLFFTFFSLLLSCSAQNKNKNKKIDIFLTKADASNKTATENLKKISVELAISPEEQQRGFMEREVIPEGTGMIFLYKEDKKMHFWMKNTPHPLSIAYIDSSGMIREIYDMTPYSLQSVSSIHSVRYALEVPQGMFERLGITVGDKISQKSILLIKRQLY